MLVSLIVFIVILGLIYWLVSLIPLPTPFPTIVKVIFIIIAVLYILQTLGIYNSGLSI